MKNLLAKCPIDIKDNSLQYHAAVNDVMTLAFAQGRKASCWILIFHGECSDSGVRQCLGSKGPGTKEEIHEVLMMIRGRCSAKLLIWRRRFRYSTSIPPPRMQKFVTRMLWKCTMFLRSVQPSTKGVIVSGSLRTTRPILRTLCICTDQTTLGMAVEDG